LSKLCASAPATLMLLGEHAVLHGYHALTCAVNRRIQISLTPRQDSNITIYSARLGEFKTSIDSIKMKEPFKFVTRAIENLKPEFNIGFDLEIEADFSHQLGLGSSAAVSVAIVAVLNRWLKDKELDKRELFLQTRQLVKSVQGLGSGADVAASIYGGTILYCMEPLLIEKLSYNPPITAVYSGSKKPTVEVVRWLEEERQKNPERVNSIFKQIDSACDLAKLAINQADWTTLGRILNENQNYMQALGLSNSMLNNLNQQIRCYSAILGSKISGSGLGDCLIAIGELNAEQFPQDVTQAQLGVQQLKLAISQEGVHYASS